MCHTCVLLYCNHLTRWNIEQVIRMLRNELKIICFDKPIDQVKRYDEGNKFFLNDETYRTKFNDD